MLQDEKESILQCQVCGFFADYNDFDCFGACEGNVFCLGCHQEINSTNGKPSEQCGGCEGCGVDPVYCLPPPDMKVSDET